MATAARSSSLEMTSPSPPPQNPVPQGDATGGLIPYKNAPALISYYLGLFSVIPGLGFFLALAAVPLGISGLKRRKLHPEVRGAAHAWVGIVTGSLSLLVHAGILALFAVAWVRARR